MGKGGGGGQPQTTTAYQTNLPEYAEPYVKNMLGAAEAQVYAPGKTGFREYTPYSTDPTKYFAGPSSLQQSTYGEAAGMQTPGQFAPATGIAGMAGLGQLGAGGAYQQMATSPSAVGAFMSPYAQNVMDVQKQAAMREAQIGNVGNKLAAARQGTYGGARETLGRLEREKNLQSRLGEIQATGSQQAYDRAMQNMQFGSNLGLQGLAGASQTAGTLAGIGGQQQQADLSRMGLQNQLGGQQQQYQQNIINQAIQDYATQQQYPMIQLANMSALLRGLPLQSGTTQMYQAAPSPLSQLGGLGATALGVYGASGGFRAAQGGEVKSYAGGGMVDGYADGGGVVGNIEAQLMQMDVPQLAQIVKTSPSVSIRQKAAEILAQKQMATQSKRSMGLEGAPAPNLDDIGMANGGIVAFQNRGLVDDPLMALSGLTPEMLAEDEERRLKPKERNFYQETLGYLPEKAIPGKVSTAIANAAPPVADVIAKETPEKTTKATGISVPSDAGEYDKQIKAGLVEVNKGLGGGLAQEDLNALRENIKENQDQKFWMSLIQGGAKAMQSTSPHAMVGLGAGIEEGAKTYGKGMEAERADKKLLIAQQSALEQVEYARKTGNLNALIAAQTRLDAVKSQRENLAANKELAILSARDKAYGDLVGRLYVQTQDIDQAKAMADKVYASTNLGGMPGGSKVPEGVVVRQIKKG
jgi:hypothetical protein